MELIINEDDNNYIVSFPKKDFKKEDITSIISKIQSAPQTESKQAHNNKDSVFDSLLAIDDLKKLWPTPLLYSEKTYNQMRVLIADDHATIRKITKKILEDLGFSYSSIDEASEGLAVIEKLKKNRFDIIISDWNMPFVNGIEILNIVKAVPGIKNTPFFMVTSQGHKDNVISAIKSGVTGYLIKPFSHQSIEKTLKKALPESEPKPENK